MSNFLAQAGTILSGLSRDLDTDTTSKLAGYAAVIDTALNGFSEKQRATRLSGQFSTQGMAEQVQHFAMETRQSFTPVSAAMQAAEERMATIKGAMTLPVVSGDPVLTFLRQREIRDRLAGQDPLKI